MRIDPPSGSSVKRDDVVTVFMSTGPPMLTVPDVSNKSLADATDILTKAGFKVESSEDWSATVDAGNVISQTPAAKGTALKFSTVTLVVSKGPSATIPEDIVPGSDPGHAKAELDALGFDTVVHKKGKSIFDFSGYEVDRVEPGPGTVVAKGSRVDLYVK
jgi:serine/threonine-protein kinase